MPISGPAIALASSGRALPIAETTCSATGSTSRCQTSMVSSTHSARLQAATPRDARGQVGRRVEPVVGQAQGVGDLGALPVGGGSGPASWATVRRATSLARFQFTEPSWGCIIACIWPISADEVGHAAGARGAGPAGAAEGATEGLNICSNGVPLNGLPLLRSVTGSFLMAPNYSAAPLRLVRTLCTLDA